MTSGILLSKAKLQRINEIIFSKEIVNSFQYWIIVKLTDSFKIPIWSLSYIQEQPWLPLV